jgi:YfiH family protein
MFVKSNILRSPHAFATRRGGVSENEHTKSLNLAFGRGDEDEIVLKNLDIFAQEVGFERESIVSLPQIHSDRIFTVTKEMCGQGYFIRDGIESGDGYVTAERGVTLGIKTADCTPILLEAEKDSEIIAIGAVHAGWRGTVADIVGKCVQRLVSELGAERQSIRAAIGPCIHKCCYEVSEDLYFEVAKGLSDDMARRFVLPSKEVEGKFYCDLVGINRELLISHGLCDENIDIIDECTCCIPEKYFSHRYSNGHRGTMLNVIFME